MVSKAQVTLQEKAQLAEGSGKRGGLSWALQNAEELAKQTWREARHQNYTTHCSTPQVRLVAVDIHLFLTLYCMSGTANF